PVPGAHLLDEVLDVAGGVELIGGLPPARDRGPAELRGVVVEKAEGALVEPPPAGPRRGALLARHPRGGDLLQDEAPPVLLLGGPEHLVARARGQADALLHVQGEAEEDDAGLEVRLRLGPPVDHAATARLAGVLFLLLDDEPEGDPAAPEQQ